MIEFWVGRLAHGLHPRGAVDMHDARNPVAPFGPHGLGNQHERRVLLAFENVFHPFGQHDRRERPERLPVLDAAVEDVLHLSPSRIGQQAAIAERARPEFGRPLKPADHLLVGQQFCGIAADVVAAYRTDLDAHQRLLLRVDDLVLAVGAAGVGVLHHGGTALLQHFQPAVIGAADRNPVVAGRRLDPHILEAAFARDPAVGHAVQRHAAGDAEVFRSRRLAQPARPRQQHILSVILYPPGEVLPMPHRRVFFPVT